MPVPVAVTTTGAPLQAVSERELIDIVNCALRRVDEDKTKKMQSSFLIGS